MSRGVVPSARTSAPPYADYTGTVPAGATPPYDEYLGSASYGVCPLCGFEFGNDDNPGGTALPMSFDAYREEWVAGGRQVFYLKGLQGHSR
jgi:hypothetical protein